MCLRLATTVLFAAACSSSVLFANVPGTSVAKSVVESWALVRLPVHTKLPYCTRRLTWLRCVFCGGVNVGRIVLRNVYHLPHGFGDSSLEVYRVAVVVA